MCVYVCVCVCVCILALVILHENPILSKQQNIVTRGLSGCTTFFDIVFYLLTYLLHGAESFLRS